MAVEAGAPPPARNYLLFHVGRFKWLYAVGFFMLLGATIAQQLAPLALRFAIDSIGDGIGGSGATTLTLAGYAAMILVLAAVEGYLRYRSRHIVSGSARHVEYALRDDMARQLLNIDQQFFVRSRTGDLMSRCTNDLEWIRNFTGPVLVDLARTVIVLIVGTTFLMFIDVRLSLIALSYLPFVAIAMAFFETAVERKYMRVQEQFGILSNRAQENISGIRAVKAHAQEPGEIAAFEAESTEMVGRSIALAWYLGGLFIGMVFLILFWLSWKLALVMYVFLVPLVILMRHFALAQRSAFRDQRLWLARVNAYLNELITGVAVIQMFNRQNRNMLRFDEQNSGTLQANLRILFWYAIFEPTVVLFGAITMSAILVYGGFLALDQALTLGTLVAFISYMQQFYAPIRQLSEQYTTLQSAMASSERIFTLMDEPEEVVDVEHPVVLDEIRGKIEFRDVWFAYDADNWVLKDVSFTALPGRASQR